MIAYFDSSVILRLLLREPKPLRELKQLEKGITSALSEVEVLRTLDRLRLLESRPEAGLIALRERAFSFLAALDIVELSPPVLRRAADPFPTVVRTLDALHLATASVWRDFNAGAALYFATHDGDQSAAARALGFEVIGS